MNQDVYEYYQTYDQCKKKVTYWHKAWPNWLLLYLNNHLKNGDWILLDVLKVES